MEPICSQLSTQFRIRWIAFIVGFLIAFISHVQSETPNCPTECICVSNRMNCEKPGLRQLPVPYMPQLEFLLVQNQTFRSNHLGPGELRLYKSPTYGGKVSLKHLYIRFCNIETVGSYAFKELGAQLQMIDLTGNPLTRIGDYAFSGIDQLTLILDEIKLPTFTEHAFIGLTKLKSLIMRHSHLTSLPFEPLVKLASEGKLDKLLLKGNKLRHLDSKYDAIFQHLQDFEISDNPWHCNCQLTWLIRRYRQMLRMRNQVFRSRRQRWDASAFSEWDHPDENQPKCGSPPTLTGRVFTDLITEPEQVYHAISENRDKFPPPTLLHCPPPRIDRLDVDLKDIFQNLQSTDGPNMNKDKEAAVRIRCVMTGSPQLAIYWKYLHPDGGWKNVSADVYNPHQSYLEQSVLENTPWLMKINDIVRSESSLTVNRTRSLDVYTCLGEDALGNVSMLIRINWPTKQIVTNHRKPIPPQLNKTIQDKTNEAAMLHQFESVYGEKQFHAIHLLVAVVITFSITFFAFLACLLLWHKNYDCHGKKLDKVLKTGTVNSGGGNSTSNCSSINNNGQMKSSANEMYTNSTTSPIKSDNLTHAELIKAHALSQLFNGAAYNTYQTRPMRGLQFPPGILNCTSPNSIPSCEPVVYADANNFTYDHPLAGAMNLSAMGYPSAPIEQHVPLLFTDAALAWSNANGFQSTLMIPPPPSIPQPSLPASTTSLAMNNPT